MRASFDPLVSAEDRYLGADHAWGGGLDIKYFFCRYIGVGLEGWAVSARQSIRYVAVFAGMTSHPSVSERQTIGGALATVTLRYPIGDSRFAPYAFAGGGAIAGGGQQLAFESVNLSGQPGGTNPLRPVYTDSQTKALGQFGGGFEIRLNSHLGLINDFSWNVIDGPNNDFGMVRTGLNFAF